MFNDVAEWKQYHRHCCALSNGLEQCLTQASAAGNEGKDLRTHSMRELVANAFENVLVKVAKLYKVKENRLLDEYRAIVVEMSQVDKCGLFGDISFATAGHFVGSDKSKERKAFWADSARNTAIKREKLRWRLKQLYVHLNGLVSYLQLHSSGFRSTMRKFEKQYFLTIQDICSPLLRSHLDSRECDVLRNRLRSTVDLYSLVCCEGNTPQAHAQLQTHLRELRSKALTDIACCKRHKARSVRARGLERRSLGPVLTSWLGCQKANGDIELVVLRDDNAPINL